jgi:hypothetical protein
MWCRDGIRIGPVRFPPLTAVMIAVVAIGVVVPVVGGCGGSDDEKPSQAQKSATSERQAEDETDPRAIERCFSRVGLKAPGDLRERRDTDYQINFPADLRGNQDVTTRTKARLRACLLTKVGICTRTGPGRFPQSCDGPIGTLVGSSRP